MPTWSPVTLMLDLLQHFTLSEKHTDSPNFVCVSEREVMMEKRKSITEVGVDDIIKAGLSVEEEAKEFYRILKETIGEAKG